MPNPDMDRKIHPIDQLLAKPRNENPTSKSLRKWMDRLKEGSRVKYNE